MVYQREHASRLRIGLIGAGLHAYRNLLPSLTYLPVELVALCDVDEDRARVTARQYGAEAYTRAADMYADQDLQAVLLSVSPSQHPQLVLEALAAGLDVWTEKPPALRASDLDPLIAAQGDRIVMAGFKKVFSPAIDKVREAVAAFGPLRSLLGIYPIDIPPDGDAALAEGRDTSWLVQGCHPLSIVCDVGGPVGALTVVRGDRGGGACVFEFVDGAVGTLHLGDGGPAGQPFESYRFFLDGVHVDVENMTLVRLQRGAPEGREVTSYVPAGWDSGAIVWQPQASIASLENMSLFTQGFVPELAAFVDAVAERQQPTRGSLGFAREVMATYEAALRSAGRRIEVARAG